MQGINGEDTTTEYDGLGRVTKTLDNLRNLETTIAIERVPGNVPATEAQTVTLPADLPDEVVAEMADALELTSVYYSRETASGAPPVTTHYDRIGRPIRTIREGYNGQMTFTDTIYDQEGQIVAVSNPYDASSGTRYFTFTVYDEMGRVVTLREPAGRSTTTNYEGRVTQVSVDADDINDVDPAPQVTTTLVNVKGETIKVWDAKNLPDALDEKGDPDVMGSPSLEFALDGFGRMVGTWTLPKEGALKGDPNITAGYDALGNQTSLNDPDKGDWTYTYDALGRLRHQTDDNESETTTSYDLLNRPLTRTSTGGGTSGGYSETTQWYYYDTTTNAAKHTVHDPEHAWIGAIQRETNDVTDTTWTPGSHSTSRAYYYDDRGNPEIQLQHIDDKWFYQHTAYDTLNRPIRTEYFWRPTGLEDDYSTVPYAWQSYGLLTDYDAESYITRVYDTQGRTWWQAETSGGVKAYDYLDRPVLYTKGESYATRLSYHADSELLANINVGPLGVNEGTVVRNGYLYDGLGNLVERKDTLRGNVIEKFTYDKLNRLEDATVGSRKLAYTYLANGNIETKQDVNGAASGIYAYDAHAVTSAFGYTLGYDDNGNVTSRTGNGETWHFKWAAFDKPRWMGREKVSGEDTHTRGSAFLYGPDRQRVVHLEYDSISGGAPGHLTDKKVYLGGGMEMDFINTASSGTPAWQMETVRLYITAPGGNAGVMEMNPNATDKDDHAAQVYHYDHLGSLLAITPHGASGNTFWGDPAGRDTLYSYGPWGQRRDPGDWLDAANTQSTYTWGWDDPLTVGINEDDPSPRGYTGHEMLDDLGLIHMNGRIYDPLLGRFLSADRFVPDIFSLQAYNRYSYVYNNPLSYVDTSGYAPSRERLNEMFPLTFSGNETKGEIARRTAVNDALKADYATRPWHQRMLSSATGLHSNINEVNNSAVSEESQAVAIAETGVCEYAVVKTITSILSAAIAGIFEVLEDNDIEPTPGDTLDPQNNPNSQGEAPNQPQTTQETTERQEKGADGATSRHTIEKDSTGSTNSVTHTVTSEDGEVVHQHQKHVGTSGSERTFPDEWTGTETSPGDEVVPQGPRLPEEPRVPPYDPDLYQR